MPFIAIFTLRPLKTPKDRVGLFSKIFQQSCPKCSLGFGPKKYEYPQIRKGSVPINVLYNRWRVGLSQYVMQQHTSDAYGKVSCILNLGTRQQFGSSSRSGYSVPKKTAYGINWVGPNNGSVQFREDNLIFPFRRSNPTSPIVPTHLHSLYTEWRLPST